MADPNTDIDEYRIYFRDELRKARASALRDAEGYQDLLHCFERLGSKLSGEITGMRRYESELKAEAGDSPLAEYLPALFPACHTSFAVLFDSVRNARNEAMHQGTVARHLTKHAIELALILEDSLVSHDNKVSAFMVRYPVTASLWQPLSFLRQTMLSEAYSNLPVFCDQDKSWYLISDYDLASGMSNWVAKKRQQGDGRSESNIRKDILAMELGQALRDGEVKAQKPHVCGTETKVADALQASQGLPVLICKDDELLGIVTPFDLL